MTNRQRRRAWRAEALIIAALMLLPLLFWWRLWVSDPSDRAAIPAGDFTDQYYPLQLFAARELAEGQLPAWDPYINAGQPGLADIQTGFYYPLNLLPNLALAALGVSFTLGRMTAQVVLHFSLASLFAYLLVRQVTRRAGARIPAARFAGAVAALTFTYSGYLTSFPVQQLTILETAIWLPLALLFVDKAVCHTRSLPYILLTGMALACALLAGHPQTAMYVVYATMAYGLFRVWSAPTPNAEAQIRQRLLRTAYCALLPLVLGVGLAAVQLVPTLGFISRSTRAGLDYEAVAWGFPVAEMIHLLYPGYLGGSPQYVGILPMILAVSALFVKRARREVLFWIVFGALALVLSLGGNTAVYRASYLLLPGFGAVRDQERIIYLFGLAMSVLAGYGALVLVQPLTRSVRRGFRAFVRGLAWLGVGFLSLTVLWYLGYIWGQQQAVEVNLFEGALRHHLLLVLTLGGSIVLFALRLWGRARRGWLMILTLVLIWLNLFCVNWRYNQAEAMAGGLFPETGLVSFLKGRPDTFRISSAGLLPGGASAGIVYELEDITGNTPLRLDAFQKFEERVGSWRRWQLLNVEYVLSERDIDGPGLERVYQEGEVKVYRVGDPLRRAWVVHGSVVADDEQAFDLLNAEGFDPREVAVLPPESADLALPGGVGPGSAAQVVKAVPGRLVLEISPDKDGLLVVSQPSYPGWQASVDGESVSIHRVNYLLQGIPVGADSRRVELSFHLSPLAGIASLVVLAACIVGLVLSLKR